jgi:hypothetical protein
MGPLRLHLGRSWQADNKAWFAGLDTPMDEAITLRADWTQVQDGEESVASVGFIRSLSAQWLIEGWASFLSAEGAETSYVLKLDFVAPLRAD